MSCDNVLEKYPLNYPSSETFLQTEAEIQLAIVGIHSVLDIQGDRIPYYIYFDNSSDIGSNRDGKPEGISQTPTAGLLFSVWSNFYKGIYRCNFVLENIDRAGDLSADKREVYKAQARVLRAYFYHYLIALFGDVPLIDHTLSIDEVYVSRESKEIITDFILSECNEAAKYLQQANEPNTMALTRGFAWAVRARTALYSERWTDVVESCQQIMALEGVEYILEPDFGDITMLKGKTSKEIIWAIQYDQDNKSHLAPSRLKARMPGGFTNTLPVQALADSYECIDGLPVDKSPLYNPQSPWENRDPRLDATMALPGSIYFGYEYETNIDSVKCWNYNVSPPARVDNLDATHAYASYSGYSWRKYCDPLENRSDGASSINAIAFRYADILLMYAEAKIEAGQLDESVYAAIEKVRTRAGMPGLERGKSQHELRCAVRKERKYELACEGLRMFDIRRWKIAERLMNGVCYGRIPNGYPSTAPTIDEYGNPDYTHFPDRERLGTKLGTRYFDPQRDYLSPIPHAERQANPNLTQNPGY
jgi:hypothetical protein